ncbi:MAG: hypothetical protein IJ705_08225 [Oscillospiraceae bacterium]|nr:hypothetical protein [Oscillospiraceae bacterium]
MDFEPGQRYQFLPIAGTGKHLCSPYAMGYNTLTLKYLRDAKGEGKTTHHIFQWRGGALECFTDEQAGDYLITKI